MKLRKALDKAKEARGEGREVISALEQKGDGKDWSAPDYSQSTGVRISPEILRKNRCVCVDPDASELDSFNKLYM